MFVTGSATSARSSVIWDSVMFPGGLSVGTNSGTMTSCPGINKKHVYVLSSMKIF